MSLSSTTAAPSDYINQSGGGFISTPVPLVENAGTTTFTTDTLSNNAARAQITDIDPSLYTAINQSGAKDILDFLSKPILLANGTFGVTDTGNSNIISIPDAFLLNSRIQNKLQGVAMFRCDVVLTLNVNAVRFQQGRYVLAWVPSGGAPTSSLGYQAFFRAHASNMQLVSQVPHVEIDLSTQTSAELRIPFTSAYPLLKVTSGTSGFPTSLGQVFIRPYSALQAGSGDTTCTWMLFGRMENVYITGNIMPQSGRRRDTMSITRKEQLSSNSMNAGPISSPLTTLSVGTGILAGLPFLGSAMSTVSWVSGILARSASAFGFAKPPQSEQATRVVRYGFPYAGVTDNFSPAMPLALKTDNEVKIHSGVGRTDIDEMSLDFIKQQYAYYITTNWSNVSTQGTILAAIPHAPGAFYSSLGVNGYTCPPVTFCTQSFRFWRGGLKFRIKIVKTEFHSGRLIIAYSPNLATGILPPTPTIDTSTFLVREIVDIRDTAEIEFCVPYVVPELYQPTAYNPSFPYVNAAGIFYIMVGDVLVAPSSVQASVNILIEVAGAPDFEVQLPNATTIEPLIPFGTQSVKFVEDVTIPKAHKIKFQSTYVKQECEELGTSAADIEYSAVAIGENFQSFRQLIKRPTPLAPKTSAIETGAAGQAFVFYPYVINPIFEVGSIGGTTVPDNWRCDFISRLSLSYVFNNGGMRLYAPLVGTVQPDILQATVDRDPLITVVGTPTIASYVAAFPTYSDGPSQIFIPVKDDPVHVSAPAYNRTIARMTCQQIVNSSSRMTPATNETQGINLTTITLSPRSPTTGASSAFTVFPFRYTSDDYSMSFWIGTVPNA